MKRKNDIKLTDFEREILDRYEAGELGVGEVPADYKRMAKETLRKNKNINIRISEQDLESIKMKAAREGLPYQTLIGSILHKFAVRGEI